MEQASTAHSNYLKKVRRELGEWKIKQQRPPSFFDRTTAKAQRTLNGYIPDKVHAAITMSMQQMVKAVLFGSKYTSIKPLRDKGLLYRELLVKDKIKSYRNTASAEGGVTGAGGLLMGMADFPILLAIKIKLLYAIAALYGFDTNDYRERLFLLHIFQLAFSSREEALKVFHKIEQWDSVVSALPTDINTFDWLTFQQQYRDYIDLAKLAQLLPLVGAVVGAVANYQLVARMGYVAMQSYRIRLIK